MKALYVHGGVSGRTQGALTLAGALRARTSETALDAVEAAVEVLEDHPGLNAGFGAVLNREGEIELDAGIADGRTARWAGVMSVSVRHPVALARRVLEDTPHVLLSGRGAMRLGVEVGLEILDATTEEQRMRWKLASRTGFGAFGDPGDVDTVGAVAVDGAGGPAAACSTGGLFGKLPGRVGDAPIYGAGIYATMGAAVVGTGLGELFLRESACRLVGEQIEDGGRPQEVVEEIVADLSGRTDSLIGLLALDSRGRVGAAFVGRSWHVEGVGADLSPRRIGPGG